MIEIAVVGNPNIFEAHEKNQQPYFYEEPIPSGGSIEHSLTLPQALHRAMARKTPVVVEIGGVQHTFNGEHIAYFREL